MIINKNNIRVVRRSYNTCRKFWHSVEININGKWMVPYFVNKTLKRTDYILRSFNPNDNDGKIKWCLEKIDVINNLIKNGYEIVDYKTYNDYYEQFRQERLGNKYTYI